MKLTISKIELQKGLTRIQSIVEKRNTMPILANVLLDASTKKPQTLTLSATDLEVGIRGTHPAEVKTAGKATVSAKKLYEIVRELPDEPISLEVTANAFMQIRCDRAKFTLAGNAAEEYPTLPDFISGKTMPVQGLFLSQMIERTIYAASADETRYNLNGVYFEQLADSQKARMVATDGHRLAIVDRELGTSLGKLKSGVIIPRKGLVELKRLLDEEDSGEVELGFEGNSGLVRKGDVTLVMRLIEGEFPNYQQVIPRETDLGDAQEELDVDYAGEALTVAFNARYLIDALNSVKAKEVRLGFKDATSPAQLTPTDDDDALAVVMPMRV